MLYLQNYRIQQLLFVRVYRVNAGQNKRGDE